ncbi:MAG: IS6 family transposase [Nitratireductor sp.]|nr:IS6 family transposase [Roseovarius confluentis]
MAQRKNPFNRHRFPREIILLAVRWYCRYPLSCRDVRDMLSERGVTVDASTIHRWVRKFGPEIRERAYSGHRSWRGLQWHVDETYIRVGGRWCYLWRAVDQFGQLIDFRLTARRNAKAARAYLRQARETVRASLILQSMYSICSKPLFQALSAGLMTVMNGLTFVLEGVNLSRK